MPRRFQTFGLLALLFYSPPLQALTLAPPGSGFSINMPGTPMHSRETHRSFVGAVDENSYTVNRGKATYTASVSILPGAAVALGGSGTILGRAKDGLLKESGGSEISYEKIRLGNYEGRQLVYSLPTGGRGKAKLYLVDKRLYVLVGAGPPDASAAIERFLDSFKLQ